MVNNKASSVFLKRVFDLTLAGFGLLLLSPLLVFLCFLILATEGPPVFFVQKRIGKGLRPFRMIKFRTMTPLQNASEGRFDAGDSQRITDLGAFLRKWKLDELPQLYNVLAGDMSIVGPRPEVKKWVDAYPERFKKVLSQVRPGITDFAAINIRNEEALLARQKCPATYYRDVILPEKLKFYEHYVSKRSFFLDIRLTVETVRGIVSRRARKSGARPT